MMKRPSAPDLNELGAPVDGTPQRINRRVFVELLAFTGVVDTGELVASLQASSLRAVLYADAHDPYGVGLVVVSEDPAVFTGELRSVLGQEPWDELEPVPELTMMGRTYGSGRERDLEDWLIHRVPARLADPAMPWAVWYPLRRKPPFYQLEPADSARVLAEHGMLGRTYGEAGLAQDVRLKCFGLDRNDNEFLIGLIGPELHPLSHLVEEMRHTDQTAQWLENLGPFFVGHRVGVANLP